MSLKLFSLESLPIGDKGWSVIGYEHHLEYIQKIDTTFSELLILIDFHETQEVDSFRWTIEVGTIQFQVGLFKKTKKIKIASKQLSTELCLMHTPVIKEGELDAVKDFIQDIAQIPTENTPMKIEYISFKNELPLFIEEEFLDTNSKMEEMSEQLIEEISGYRQTLFEKISDFGLDLTANFMLIRIHLLKYLAILPCLDHDKKGHEVKRLFLETLTRLIADSKKAEEKKLKGQNRSLPSFYIKLFSLLHFFGKKVPANILAILIRWSVSMMAQRFIAGESIHKAKGALNSLLRTNRFATIDQLGELVVSNKEADEYKDKVLEIIYGFGELVTKGTKNSAGILQAHVSIKVTALTNDFKPQDIQYCYESIAPRLKEILLAAKKECVFINIDAEHYHYRDAVFEIYKRVLLETEELQTFEHTGIVVQAYLRDALAHLRQVQALAKQRGLIMPIRLVKGAYWDAETIEATAHNFESPQFINKEETDLHFRQLVYVILKAKTELQLTVASHNIQDHCFCEALYQTHFEDSPQIEHQCLHMTYEALSVGLSKLNFPTRNYIPVGNLLVGMAYLVRRIMENSSQVGVLMMMRSHKKAMNFATPYQLLVENKVKHNFNYDESDSFMTSEFKNVYPVRTYLTNHLKRMDHSLGSYIASAKNNKITSKESKHQIFSSSYLDLLLGEITLDTKETTCEKIDRLFKHYDNDWYSNHLLRNLCLLRLSDELLINREDLSALIMMEAGKSIEEAIADVDEAIDFIHFYVREQNLLNINGNIGAKGVVGVIAPWNFPLAIPCGMSVAALCAGNSVILKPAEQTNLIAQEFYRLAIKAGIPEDNFQIAYGEVEVGQAIVNHPLLNGIVFTGSKPVGELIYKSIRSHFSSKLYKSFKIPKFAITEMGGKNAIIVTNNCELDETISGILYASFAHAGQKCSAASRIIIDEEIKEVFKERFKKAVHDLKVSKADDFSTFVNPLVSREDKERVIKMAQEARAEVHQFGGDVVIDLSGQDYPGFCVGPSVFELSAKTFFENNTVASREVFGPVIHIIPFKDLDEAIEIFNHTEYALTGGIFCQSQDDIDYILPKLRAGNIYINRPNTGARVAIEPFGGFKMSGTGPKAGSKEYLNQFNRQLEHNRTFDKTNFEAAQSSQLFFATETQLPLARRIISIRTIVETLSFQFTELIGEVNEFDKAKLDQLLKDIDEGLFNLTERTFPNREIPGQISYSKRDVGLGSGVILDATESFDIQLLIDFIINLIVGNGITILTTNVRIYNRWKNVVGLAYQNGISEFNLYLSLVTKDDLLAFINDNPIDFVVFSMFDVDREILDKLMFTEQNRQGLIKLIFSGYHESFDDGILSFTHCRSFAINTMRHGAPLDTGIY